jgi:hypothetical protein
MRPVAAMAVTLTIMLAASASALGETIVDANGGYTFKAPRGFEPAPPEIQNPGFEHMYILGDPADRAGSVVLCLRLLKETIPQQHWTKEYASRAGLPEGSVPSLSRAKWQGLEIDVIEFRFDVKGNKRVAFIARVPLMPKAVNLTVFGPASREKEVRDALTAALDGLDGTTNWLTTSAAAGLVVFLLVCAGVAGLIFLRHRRVKASQQKGAPPPVPGSA